jgi:hypothetical protein
MICIRSQDAIKHIATLTLSSPHLQRRRQGGFGGAAPVRRRSLPVYFLSADREVSSEFMIFHSQRACVFHALNFQSIESSNRSKNRPWLPTGTQHVVRRICVVPCELTHLRVRRKKAGSHNTHTSATSRGTPADTERRRPAEEGRRDRGGPSAAGGGGSKSTELRDLPCLSTAL